MQSTAILRSRNAVLFNVVTSVLFLLSPIVALPFVLYGIYMRNRWSYTLMALFLGLLGFLTAPNGDLFRHTQEYFEFRYFSLKDILLSYEDYTTQIATYWLSTHDIPYPYLRLFNTTIAYLIMFYLLNYYLDANNHLYNKRDSFLRFILVIITSNFFILVIGVRYWFALTFFVLGYHLFFLQKKRLLGIICLVFAILTHNSLLYFTILFLAFSLIKTRKQYILTICIVLFLLGILSKSLMMSNLSDFSVYFSDSKWGSNRMDNFDVAIRKYQYIFDRICRLLVLFIISRHYYNKCEMFSRWFVGMLFCYCLFNRFTTVGGRALDAATCFIPLFVLYNEQTGKSSKQFFNTFFTVLSVLFIMNTAGFQTNIKASKYEQMLFPVPLILQHDFDMYYLNNYLDEGGSWIKHNYRHG